MKQNQENQENQEFPYLDLKNIADPKTLIEGYQKNVDQGRQYLGKIPILKSINDINSPQNMNQVALGDPSNHLALDLKFLLEDKSLYYCNFTSFANDNKKCFFVFYDGVNTWLKFKCENEKTYSDKKKEFKLDHPYRLALELFVEYVNFRKNAKKGAQYKNGYNNSQGPYEPNIRDLFTDEDLIELGGNEFIKDCYTAIGQNNLSEKYKLNNKSCIQNINSRTGKKLKSVKDVKPNLYERVDKYLSWKIFKDGKVKDLKNDEVSILNEAMKNEGFWKHLGKTELKILLFTGGAALILGLIAAFAFGATGGALLALILTPIGAGALVIAPSMTPSMRKSAIVDNMINISNQNKEFNNKIEPGEKKYRQYKLENLDFAKFLQSKSEPEKGNDIIKENRIIPKNDEQNKQNEQNEQNKQNHPLEKVNETNQNQNNQGNGKEENKEGNEEP